MKPQHTDPFHAIADVNRREILHLLSKKDMSINALANNFDISRPAVSKHIKILTSAGFISIKQSGREHQCSLNTDGFEQIRQWMEHYEKFWHKRLSALEKYLDEVHGQAKGKKRGKQAGKR